MEGLEERGDRERRDPAIGDQKKTRLSDEEGRPQASARRHLDEILRTKRKRTKRPACKEKKEEETREQGAKGQEGETKVQ